MEGYPKELILHHVPLMAVIGLSSTAASSSLANQSSTSTSMDNISDNRHIAPSSNAQKDTYASASSSSSLSALSSNDLVSTSSKPIPTSSSVSMDELYLQSQQQQFLEPLSSFSSNIKKYLLTTLTSNNNASIWDHANGKGIGIFHVVGFDKVLPLDTRLYS